MTEVGRLRLAPFHVQTGSTIWMSAEIFQVSTTTVIRWAGRYRQLLAKGIERTARDVSDRPSWPRTSPSRTPARLEREIHHLRAKRPVGPVQIGGWVGLAPSTMHAIPVRAGLTRLDHADRVSGERIHRTERERREKIWFMSM